MKFELVEPDDSHAQGPPGDAQAADTAPPRHDHSEAMRTEVLHQAPEQALNSMNTAISQMAASLAQLDARVAQHQAEVAETGRPTCASPPVGFQPHRFGRSLMGAVPDENENREVAG